MAPQGWIKLHRKSMESQVWANSQLWHLWCYCLLRANHKDKWVNIKTGRGETEVLVKSGQFLFGRKKAGESLRQKSISVYRRLKKLSAMGNLNLKPDTHYTVVSICNWETYQNCDIPREQASEPAMNTQVTTNEHPSNTNKNVKNAKNVKNEKKDKYMDFVFLSSEEYKKLIERFGEDTTKDKIAELNEGIGSKGYKYKSHYHTILSWQRKHDKDNPQAKKSNPETCFHCKTPSSTKIPTGAGSQFMCSECLELLKKAEPNLSKFNKVLPKSSESLSRLEIMIEKQKAKR